MPNVVSESSAYPLQVSDPVTRLSGIGPKIAERMARLKIHTIMDLLLHLPIHYQDRTRLTPIAALRVGYAALVEGKVQSTQIRTGNRRTLLVRISDGTGILQLRFFHFNLTQQAMFSVGSRLRCFGEIRQSIGIYEIVHPEFQGQGLQDQNEVEEYLTPIYSTTEGLHQLTLRKYTKLALECLAESEPLDDLLVETDLAQHNLPELSEAIVLLHRPPPSISLETLENRQHPAQQRLIVDELIATFLSLRRLRKAVKAQLAPKFAEGMVLVERLRASLPFPLTNAQQRVCMSMHTELLGEKPMLRLLQGDVGAGKTVVSALVAAQAMGSGYQVALMVPTELLAEQHLHSFQAWFTPLGYKVWYLTGKLDKTTRNQTLEELGKAEPCLVVGTHALFQDDVQFGKLGLVMVDEQHRFGVHQRLALLEKGCQNNTYPHQLIMTATPIPRTLAMTVYGDMDSSVIDELPPHRKPVRTSVIPDTRRDEIIARIKQVCEQGCQVYWVCTLIEESEALQCQTATNTASELTAMLSPLRVGLLHGRVKNEERLQIMSAFSHGEINILVATTVIEVGVDVPNASLIIIENAERLGLAQLHQLRGRVGRGAQQSDCILLYKAPLSDDARARLAILRETNDGFLIAEKDLEIRGPGEILGTRQTGLLQLRIADLVRDREILPLVEACAEQLLDHYPDRIDPLIQRWVGDAEEFIRV